jgi:hypothetical protein
MNAVMFDELLKAPVTDLSSKTQVDAWYDGTKYMHDFSREVMLPLLKMLLGPSHQEIAVRDTYYRMSLLLRSVLVMNSLDHFQSVASLTRSLFELWLDLSILAQDTTGEAVRKYNEFPEIERYRVAEQLIRFAATNTQSLKMDITAQRTFHADAQRTQRIAKIVKSDPKGKRKYPDHWTSKSVRQRAIEVGQEVMYVEAYPQLSWYVHAGAAGTAGITREGFEHVFGFCHSLIQRMFVDATSKCAKATKISSLDYFDAWMQSIRLKTGEIIVAEQIKVLEAKRQQGAKGGASA